MLRPYQQEAHDAVIAWIKKTTASCVIDAATGSGKSHIVAALSNTIHKMSGGKHILCLAPSAELVMQNRDKFRATGNKASVFSASLGLKSLKHPVVFGTPVTVANSVDKFCGRFAAVIIDEAHCITPTIKKIIEHIKSQNDKLRVIGLSATPYRLNDGYIYKANLDGMLENEKAYFDRLVYKIDAKTLIEQGYLTKPVVGGTKDHYDTLHMHINKLGQFDKSDIDTAYKGKGRKTAKIIEDIVSKSHGHAGVMIFAATVEHAHECMQSLPQELSAIVTGETKKKERQRILKQFNDRRIKYLVNVSVLTTGFDAPHVSIIAMLRATESASLLQQIIGRGLRISEHKDHCLILDYAQNIERHCPDGDIFNPQIKRGKEKDELEKIDCTCPSCGKKNTFLSRQNPDGYGLHESGYFADITGAQLKIPSHYGRRCQAYHISKAGSLEQCSYRWIGKVCDKCGHENDIAARFCEKCKHELINPNDPLVIDSNLKDMVLSWRVSTGVSKSNKEFTKIMYVLASGKIIPVWYTHHYIGREAMQKLKEATDDLRTPPLEIEYYKNLQTGFYEIINYKKAKNLLTAVK